MRSSLTVHPDDSIPQPRFDQVSRFFETHQCNPLCRRLGLEMVRMEDFSGKSIGLSGSRAREERAERTIAPGSHMPALIR